MTGSNALPVVDPNRPQKRDVADVIAMAVVAQANVAQLRTAEVKRGSTEADRHDIRTPPPGAVTKFREALIDYKNIRAYSDAELHLRLHEVWGQFCLFCWVLDIKNPADPPSLASLPPHHEMHCDSSLNLKMSEIAGYLWRLQFEQRIRHDAMFRDSLEYKRQLAFAEQIPVKVFGNDPTKADGNAVLLAACEHAGMLAAVRWIVDRRVKWGQPGIMDVDPAMFEDLPANES